MIGIYLHRVKGIVSKKSSFLLTDALCSNCSVFSVHRVDCFLSCCRLLVIDIYVRGGRPIPGQPLAARGVEPFFFKPSLLLLLFFVIYMYQTVHSIMFFFFLFHSFISGLREVVINDLEIHSMLVMREHFGSRFRKVVFFKSYVI